MSNKTGIEWTDATWNPVRGCSRVSEGCRNCYAERQAVRFAGPGMAYENLVTMTSQGPKWTGKIDLVASRLSEPLRLKDPHRIFVNSMGDLFHPSVPDVFIADVFAYMAVGYWHTYQVLTKHPDRMSSLLNNPTFHIIFDDALALALDETEAILRRRPRGTDIRQLASETLPLPNVWIGVSVENQAKADERVPLLLETPAAVRWLSMEPLLGPVSFEGLFANPNDMRDGTNALELLNWVIVGGESGKGARPMHPDWARSLRDQCAAASVPFLFKQWGEWLPAVAGRSVLGKTLTVEGQAPFKDNPQWHAFEDGQMMARIGKKAAGRLLDGRTWDEYPEVST